MAGTDRQTDRHGRSPSQQDHWTSDAKVVAARSACSSLWTGLRLRRVTPSPRQRERRLAPRLAPGRPPGSPSTRLSESPSAQWHPPPWSSLGWDEPPSQVDREAGRSTRCSCGPAMSGRSDHGCGTVCEETAAATGHCAAFKQGALSHGHHSAFRATRPGATRSVVCLSSSPRPLGGRAWLPGGRHRPAGGSWS